MKAYLRAGMALCCALVSVPAQAVVFTTYIFSAVGTGLRVDSAFPRPDLETAFTEAQAIFVLPDVIGRQQTKIVRYGFFGGDGLIYIGPSPTGMSFGYAPPRFVPESGLGQACFSNPSTLFPTSSPTLISGPSCVNRLLYRIIYSTPDLFSREEFDGTVTGLTVFDGDMFGNGEVAILRSVPEPTTWAMMLIGFAGIGYSVRRRGQPAPA